MKDYQGWQYIYLFVAIIALGFTGWYYTQPSLEINSISKETLSHLPDMMVESVHVITFNEKGLPANDFYSPKLIHFPYDNQSFFTKPNIILYSDKGEPWHIQSDKGEAFQGAEKITLLGNVILHQYASKTEKEKIITTSKIIYFNEKNGKQDIAETNETIFFDQSGLRVKSKGMTANLKKQQIYLLQNVTSEYIPDVSNKNF